jgi:hypothetical protein
VSCGLTFVLLIGWVIIDPPLTGTFLSVVQFFTIVICGGIFIAGLFAYVLSWWFTNSVIPENLRYEPIDSDSFLEILLEEGLNTEPNLKMGQNRLSRMEINQINSAVKKRLKQELRRNLREITYNTLMIWFVIWFLVFSIFFILVVIFIFTR